MPESLERSLFASFPLPAWVFDRQTLAFLAVNDAALQHFGYSREEFLAMSIVEWGGFFDYEERLNRYLSDKAMLVLCAYPLAAGRGAGVARTHPSAVLRREGETGPPARS